MFFLIKLITIMASHSCHVSGCRYPYTHTTPGHLCGECKKYGHGRIECGNQATIRSLEIHKDDRLHSQDWCELCGSQTHSNASHHCERCCQRGITDARPE